MKCLIFHLYDTFLVLLVHVDFKVIYDSIDPEGTWTLRPVIPIQCSTFQYKNKNTKSILRRYWILQLFQIIAHCDKKYSTWYLSSLLLHIFVNMYFVYNFKSINTYILHSLLFFFFFSVVHISYSLVVFLCDSVLCNCHKLLDAYICLGINRVFILSIISYLVTKQRKTGEKPTNCTNVS